MTTAGWCRLARLDGTEFTLQASRLLPGFNSPFPGGHIRFLEPTGGRVQIAIFPTFGTAWPATINFDGFDGPPLEGDPEELLAGWQKKLALKITDTGDIVPSN